MRLVPCNGGKCDNGWKEVKKKITYSATWTQSSSQAHPRLHISGEGDIKAQELQNSRGILAFFQIAPFLPKMWILRAFVSCYIWGFSPVFFSIKHYIFSLERALFTYIERTNQLQMALSNIKSGSHYCAKFPTAPIARQTWFKTIYWAELLKYAQIPFCTLPHIMSPSPVREVQHMMHSLGLVLSAHLFAVLALFSTSCWAALSYCEVLLDLYCSAM